MSVKRYALFMPKSEPPYFEAHPNGNYVLHSDYAALEAELKAARDNVKRLQFEKLHDVHQIGGQCEEIARLKAENAALRKAGDAMESDIRSDLYEAFLDWDEVDEMEPFSVREWNRIKHEFDAAKSKEVRP